MTTQTAPTTDKSEFDWFSDNGIFMPMINDTGRNVFYKAAIESAVPGKIVCDIGCGSGFLSILAARAGAAHVYAVEMDTGRAKFAQEVIDKIGYGDRITVINDNFLNTDIKADVYVSETIGAQIYNENILNIAEHARRQGGVFIPSQIDMWAQVYENHPIFAMTFTRSEAFEFQPDIEVHPDFEQHINTEFQTQHPLENTLYRANTTRDLFQMLPRFTDMKLNQIHTSPMVTLDLNQPVDQHAIKLIVPASAINTDEFVVVLFWRARYQDITMNVEDTWWALPSKLVLERVRKAGTDVEMYYVPEIDDWRLRF